MQSPRTPSPRVPGLDPGTHAATPEPIPPRLKATPRNPANKRHTPTHRKNAIAPKAPNRLLHNPNRQAIIPP